MNNKLHYNVDIVIIIINRFKVKKNSQMKLIISMKVNYIHLNYMFIKS